MRKAVDITFMGDSKGKLYKGALISFNQVIYSSLSYMK